MADKVVNDLTAHGTILETDIGIIGDTAGNAHKATQSAIKDFYVKKSRGGGKILVASADAMSYVKRGADIVCTNSDDDGDINTALTDGNVEMTDGDYEVHEQLIMNYPGHSLVGAGKGINQGGGGVGRGRGTCLLLTSGFASSSVIEVAQTAAVRPCGGVTLRDFLIEGGNFGTNVVGIHYRGFQSVIENVHVRNMTSHGINIHGYTTGEISPNGWSTYDTRITGVWCESNNGSGLYFQNGTDVILSDSWFIGNTLSGFHHDGGASLQSANCHAYGNLVHGVHLDGAGSRDKFLGWKIEHNKQHGFHLDGSTTGQTGVKIIGCGFGMNGNQTHNTYSSIKVTGTGQCGRLQIKDCDFHNADGAANLVKYCIDLGGVTVAAIISGNDFGTTPSIGGYATAPISFTGTANFEGRNNIGLNDHHSALVAAPTVVAGSGAGTSPTVAIGTGIACNDYRGSVTLTTGTGTPNTTNDQFVVTYDVPLAVTGSTVHIQGANQVSQLLGPYVSANDNNGFTVRCAVAPAASTAYAFRYIVVA
jgi:hypothetical protein